MPARTRHALPPEALAAVAARFRLLGSESRLIILQAVLDGPLSMADLQEATGLGQSNLSRRIGELEAGGCVRRRRAGGRLLVELADPSLRPLCNQVCRALEARVERQRSALRSVRTR